MSKMHSCQSYFMRRTTLSFDEDDEDAEPIFIKIPVDILSPSLDQCALLGVLSGYYAADPYIIIDTLVEDMPEYGKISLVPFGVTSNVTLLITSCEEGLEVISGLITPMGEFELGFFDGNQMVLPIMDNDITEELGLRISEEVLVAHNDFLRSIDCEDCEERVYVPIALYT